MRFKIKYKSKTVNALYAALNNFEICILFGTLIFAILSLFLSSVFDYDTINVRFLSAYCIIVFAVFIILMCIYFCTEKGVKIDNSLLTINLGYYGFGKVEIAGFNKKIKLTDIEEYKITNESNTIKSERPVYKIISGDYSGDYLEIDIYNSRRILLPAENAEELYNKINIYKSRL
ncbi:MAG: hypothetical protein LIO62_05630 [Clostridiales bacterium]|nr:hypothetical protein [Clostridiales bacterium]